MDPNPPAGWLTDPEDPSHLRWWDGQQWTEHRTPVVVAPEAAVPWRPSPLLVVVSIGVLLVAFLVAAQSGVGGFLSTVGLAALVIAIIALVRGGIAALGLRGKPAAGIVLAAGIGVLVLGGGVNAATVRTDAPLQPFVATGETRSAEPTAAPTSTSPKPTPTPEVVTSTVTEQQPIPFGAVSVDDPNVASGTSFVSTPGTNGVLTITYSVSTRDGVEIGREKIGEAVTTPPIDQVTTIGTQVQRAPAPAPQPGGGSGCDPNYSGCVPIAPDVDCAGGSGNGPAYATGPITVIGTDIYDLDRDGDGVACD